MRHPLRALLFLLLAACLSLPPSAGGAKPDPPNFVLILADDMGFSDLGCYGSEIATPNLDRLAAGGLRFSQFYTTPRCCPSRASLLTGLYPHQVGVGHMVRNEGSPAYEGYLNDRCVTLAEALRGAGYHTLMSGKWHLGAERPHWPVDRGFERSFALLGGESSYFHPNEGGKLVLDDHPYVARQDAAALDRFYMTDAITHHALRFLQEYGRRKEPFFLYLAYTAPHWPLHALPADIARYRGKYRRGWDALREARRRRMADLGLLNPSWPLSPRDPEVPPWTRVKKKAGWDLRMAVYAAQVDRMDQDIGRVLARLREIGAGENTLVMFLSDNGGSAERVHEFGKNAPPGGPKSHASYERPWANASNTPFRLYKHWVHEGGIATPLIVSGPGVARAGRITDQVGHVMDIVPTCLELAGAPYPAASRRRAPLPLEGRSLAPVFRDETRSAYPPLFWEHEGNRAARLGRWKLVSRFPRGWELYDMEADRTELNDLSGRYPGKVQELAGLYEGWAKRCGVTARGRGAMERRRDRGKGRRGTKGEGARAEGRTFLRLVGHLPRKLPFDPRAPVTGIGPSPSEMAGTRARVGARRAG
jgi:arylsulfatase